MKILVTALHVRNDLFGAKLNLAIGSVHNTHVEIGNWITGTLGVDPPDEGTMEAVLETVFKHFNWIDEKDGYAGEMVNMICRHNETHASMSVGDVIKLQYLPFRALDTVTRYFEVDSVGFSEITKVSNVVGVRR